MSFRFHSKKKKNDLQGEKYVILVDETADVATQKHICIIVRFYCDKKDNIQTVFRSLVPVFETTALILFYIVVGEITKVGQIPRICIGFASEGAAPMVGGNNSMWLRIKNESPNCVQIKCINHSLSLSIKHAFLRLPSNIDFPLTNVPLWLSNSARRREDHKALLEVMKPADEENSRKRDVPLPLKKYIQCKMVGWRKEIV